LKYAHPPIPRELYERLKATARELGLSVPELLEKLLESYKAQTQQPKTVSDTAYSKLQALASRLGYESPDTLLIQLLDWWEPLLTQSKIAVKDTWIYVEIGDSRVAFNITQVDKMCKLRILPARICEEVRARIPWL